MKKYRLQTSLRNSENINLKGKIWYKKYFKYSFNMSMVPFKLLEAKESMNLSENTTLVFYCTRFFNWNISKGFKPGYDQNICTDPKPPRKYKSNGIHFWNNWGIRRYHNNIFRIGTLDYKTGELTQSLRFPDNFVYNFNLNELELSHFQQSDIRMDVFQLNKDLVKLIIFFPCLRDESFVQLSFNIFFQDNQFKFMDYDKQVIKNIKELLNNITRLSNNSENLSMEYSNYFENNHVTAFNSLGTIIPDYALLSTTATRTNEDDLSQILRDGIKDRIPKYSFSTNTFDYDTKMYTLGHVKIISEGKDLSLPFIQIRKWFENYFVNQNYVQYWGKTKQNPCRWEIYMAVLYRFQMKDDTKRIMEVSDCFIPVPLSYEHSNLVSASNHLAFSLFFPMNAWIHNGNLIITGGEGDTFCIVCSIPMNFLLSKLSFYHVEKFKHGQNPGYFAINTDKWITICPPSFKSTQYDEII